jgi:hypothetical protein
MDALDFFLLRYDETHRALVKDLLAGLSEAQLRGRAHVGVNTVAWLVWHSARIEDVGVNRFVVDRPQVLAEWSGRLGVDRRDVGTGMSDAEVDALSDAVDLTALRGYWDAVTERTAAVIPTLRGTDIDTVADPDHVRKVCVGEGIVASGAEWLTEFWAKSRKRSWLLAQMALLHPYAHYYEARVAAGLWGQRSP